MRRLATRLAIAAALLLAAACTSIFLSMRPGNPDLFPPKPGEPCISVYVVSRGYHSGVVLSRDDLFAETQTGKRTALNDVLDRFRDFDTLEFGWGDAGFYHNVRTIGDLQILDALRALFRPGNPSVMHVVGLRENPRLFFPQAEIMQITLSPRGFSALLPELNRSFAVGAGAHTEELGPGLYGPSFFTARPGHLICSMSAQSLGRAFAQCSWGASQSSPIHPAGRIVFRSWRAGPCASACAATFTQYSELISYREND